jgi:hypothetical protein
MIAKAEFEPEMASILRRPDIQADSAQKLRTGPVWHFDAATDQLDISAHGSVARNLDISSPFFVSEQFILSHSATDAASLDQARLDLRLL